MNNDQRTKNIHMDIPDHYFFKKDVLNVAPALLGCDLVRQFDDGQQSRLMINEVEAYRGEEDLACHVSKGRTPRNEVMYHQGGLIYVYLIYGMYWMFNIVTEDIEIPQAVLVRGAGKFDGPGKLTRHLLIDKSFYGEDITQSVRLWIEKKDIPSTMQILTGPRVGIDYAGEQWKNKSWRYMLIDQDSGEPRKNSRSRTKKSK